MITLNTNKIDQTVNIEIVRTARLTAMKAKVEEMLPPALQQIEAILTKAKITVSETNIFFTDTATNNSFDRERIAVRAVLTFTEVYAPYDNFKTHRLNDKLKIATSSLISVHTDGRDVSLQFDNKSFGI